MTFLVRYEALQHLGMSTGRILQLRVQRGNENRFSNYVPPRVVRLTIETNTLTGACLSGGSLTTDFEPYIRLSYRGYRFFRALHWLPSPCEWN